MHAMTSRMEVEREFNTDTLATVVSVSCPVRERTSLLFLQRTSMTPFQERLRGNVPALLTSLTENFAVDPDGMRPEEHRSELQSLVTLVCRLLLDIRCTTRIAHQHLPATV